MSSMLSGGAGRAYGFDIENIMTYPSTTTSSSRTSNSSSTLSESINSPLEISTRKPRTPRKRPNQTYNEAAVLLSIACPKVFSTKNITNKNKNVPSKIPLTAAAGSRKSNSSFLDPAELLLPFPVTENPGFLYRKPVTEKPGSVFESNATSSPEFEYFDTESMLDEEMEHGIDSIMGISNSTTEKYEAKNGYGYPMGLGFGGNLEFKFGMGMRNGIRALKNGDGGNWWSFPMVNISPATVPVMVKKVPVEKKKKKKKRVEELMKRPESESESVNGSRLLLKLNYDDVLNAWSDKGSPLPEEVSGSESPGGDIHSKLAQIDLFSENDGLEEASVTRYKDKKSTRLVSKKN